MEENNRKGPGAFYAIIGIATLAVAVIGATFAFFSANATAQIPEGSTAAAGGVDLKVTPVTNTNTNLVPLNLRLNDTNGVDTVDQFAPAMEKGCVDENGNNVCQVYRIVVTNKSTTSSIQIRGTLELTSDASNMYWRLIGGEDDGAENPKLTSGSVVDYSSDIIATEEGGLGYLTVGGNSKASLNGTIGTGKDVSSHTLGYGSVDGDNTVTYYVVIWLEEMGTAQEGGDGQTYADAGKFFSGEVFFSAVDANGNNTGITASFTQTGGTD